jgi:sortase (surface protein transpeptidase)
MVTFRRFRTSKQNRAKSFKQIVIPLRGMPVREIAIRLQPHRQRLALAPVLFIILGISGVSFFGWQTVNVNKLESVKTFSVASAQSVKAKPAKPKGLPRSEPTHISIPSIGIDAGVMQVGLAADGSLETPPVLDYITGWYRGSPTPGEIGPSVIDGHVDNYKGISVFWRLRELTPGAEVDIARADGSTVKFKVDALQQFDQDDFPTKAVYGNINHAGLRLITCGGTFDTATGHYNQNTVVFASMVQ